MKRSRLRSLWLPMASAILLTRCDCDFFGTTGALFISEQDEVELGTEFNQHLRDSARAEYPVYAPRAGHPEDVAFQNYVVNLAQSILDNVPAGERPGYPFTFTLIANDSIDNAFAVPGGYVYIYTGIIKHMQDESELAGVLGHEIAHVTQHHYRDALAKQAGLSILVQALIGNDAGKLTQLVAQSFGALAALAITRGNEEEADEYGTRYEAKIGRNPMGIANFFQRMKDLGFTILSTHPLPTNRVAAVTAQVGANSSFTDLANNSAVTNYKARFDQYVGPIR